jgi:hypothetical protein
MSYNLNQSCMNIGKSGHFYLKQEFSYSRVKNFLILTQRIFLLVLSKIVLEKILV